MKFKIDWKIIVFLLIIALAVFLRIYHFSDWLFFKMDQARDAMVVKQALEEGPGWLPLLGPKAGGTDLNLGPAFYYFQYLSAVLFQSAHPAVLAFPDLLFGILSIPLLYLYLRKYFLREWSMILAGLYSVCFIGIQYSRFAWNPNGLVFFNLLFFFSLLNVFDSPRTTESLQDLSDKKNTTSLEESVVRGKKVKYRLRWIILTGISFSISTQLHFLSFFTLPAITAIFIILNWKDVKKIINWKYILVFIAIVALIYLPVILNEIVSKGENTAEFLKALKEKPSAHSFWKNVKRDIRYWGQNWFLILTSYITKKTGVKGAAIIWLGLILPATFLGWRLFRKEAGTKKKFVLASLLWFWVYFFAYIPIAYQIRPRFFLPLLALPFIFIGYLAQYFWARKNFFFKVSVIVALAIILFGNLYGTYLWFKEIKTAQKKAVYPKRTIILKARDGIVFWHLEQAAQYIKKNCAESRVYYGADSEYKHPVKYVLNLNGIEAFSINNYDPQIKGCFYAFGLTRAKKPKNISKVADQFELSATQKIGALTVYKYSIKPEFSESFSFTREREKKSDRVFWKDVWQ